MSFLLRNNLTHNYKLFLISSYKFLFLSALVVSVGLFMAIRQQFPTWNTEIKFSLLHIQKVLFCLLSVFILSFITRKNYVLDVLARYSFCIFFLHGFVAWGYCIPLVRTTIQIYPELNTDIVKICLQTFVVLLSVVICILVGKLCKSIFGKYSRVLLGC